MLQYSEFIYEQSSKRTHWGKIGAGALIISNATKRLLVSFRSLYCKEPHTWGIFGGAIDDNEDVEDAVKREIREETKFAKNIQLIPSYVYKSNDRSFQYFNFIGIVENEFNPILDLENDDYRWVTIDELLLLTPKHFGLQLLLKHNLSQIKSFL